MKLIIKLALVLSGFIFNLASCHTKTQTGSKSNVVSKEDSVATPNKQFIDLLFAEQTIEEINQMHQLSKADTSVWAKFFKAEKLIKEGKSDEAKTTLKEIVNDKESESRTIIWAWNGLRELGEIPASPVVLGLVLEVPQENTIEYLAMYSDRTARYINYTGSIDVWNAQDNLMDELLNDVMKKSQKFIVDQKLNLGRDKNVTDKVRFSFLTNAGVFQTEKTFAEVSGQKTEIAGIFFTSLQVLEFLVTKAKRN